MIDLKTIEKEVCSLLHSYGVNAFAQSVLAPWVAHESLKMNHLYQDLGFKSRTEMGRFMKKNFPAFAAKKPKDKLWKKFIYDQIGQTAPACVQCDDRVNCFKCSLEEAS
ncbi:nitrogen fixation protein NifQ [Sulfurimonas sp. HSL-1716]|uniref:nitrogen fixation protein NifQ n=1 Tax=Hydrocurvibacter sulfurireducens TaxID=3131937 RepID=UPI0031F83D48